jgi:hypothetical protein
LQHEIVVRAEVGADRPPVTGGGRTAEEAEDYHAACWWPAAQITRSTARFYPGRLPELRPRFLAGDTIDEPFERWN